MGKTKLVYKDDNTTKVLWGEIIGEDEIFISFRAEDGNLFRINKHSVMLVRYLHTFGV